MKLSLPLFAVLPRKTKADKKVYLNLNVFKTLHHRTIADAKIRYKESVREALFLCEDRDRYGSDRVRASYTLFPASKRRIDLQNVLPVVAKFTEDALVCLGVLDDDDSKVIAEVVYRFGAVDKSNPRAELVIERTFEEL